MDIGAPDFVLAGTIAQPQAKGRLARRLISGGERQGKTVGLK
jgi:hypothetical protein